MLDAVGIKEESHADALVALDKIDKIGANGVLKEFDDRGISGGEKLVELLNELAAGGSVSDIERLTAFIGEHEKGQAGIKELDTLLTNDIRFHVLGRPDELSADVRAAMAEKIATSLCHRLEITRPPGLHHDAFLEWLDTEVRKPPRT